MPVRQQSFYERAKTIARGIEASVARDILRECGGDEERALAWIKEVFT
jgi:hypothetical protein